MNINYKNKYLKYKKKYFFLKKQLTGGDPDDDLTIINKVIIINLHRVEYEVNDISSQIIYIFKLVDQSKILHIFSNSKLEADIESTPFTLKIIQEYFKELNENVLTIIFGHSGIIVDDNFRNNYGLMITNDESNENKIQITANDLYDLAKSNEKIHMSFNIRSCFSGLLSNLNRIPIDNISFIYADIEAKIDSKISESNNIIFFSDFNNYNLNREFKTALSTIKTKSNNKNIYFNFLEDETEIQTKYKNKLIDGGDFIKYESDEYHYSEESSSEDEDIAS